MPRLRLLVRVLMLVLLLVLEEDSSPHVPTRVSLSFNAPGFNLLASHPCRVLGSTAGWMLEQPLAGGLGDS
jgi:hypothetical protein